MAISDSEVLVNGTQTGLQTMPNVTGLSGGGWLVTWTSDADGDQSTFDPVVFQRMYDRNGNAVSGEQQVDPVTTDAHSRQDTDAISEGGWLVTWQSLSGIVVQRFDPDGDADADPVFLTDDNLTIAPEIAVLADGSWVATWTDYSAQDTFMSRYDASGNSVETELLVNSYTTGFQGFSDIAALPDGGWIVTWSSVFTGDDNQNGVYQRRYDEDGMAGEELRVNSATTGTAGDSSVAGLVDGGWIITWSADIDGDGDSEVYMNRYDATGASVGETRINSDTDGDQIYVSIAALADGGWISSWHSSMEDAGTSFHMQRYDSSGAPVGDEAIVSDLSEIGTWFPSVTGLEDGGWLVSWSSDGDSGEGKGIYQKRYTANGDEVAGALPTSQDFTVTMLEDSKHAFSADDFSVVDGDGDTLGAITITMAPTSGKLKLNGSLIVAGDEIMADDLTRLKWKPDSDAFGDGLGIMLFQVTDSRGATSLDDYAITFDVIDTVDKLRGSNGKDKLKGTDGADIINGRGGNDKLIGSDGSDTFVFRTGWDKDRIMDFDASSTDHDVLDLSGLKSVKSWYDLKHHHLQERGGDIVIDGGHGDVVTLKNVDRDDLDRSDFTF